MGVDLQNLCKDCINVDGELIFIAQSYEYTPICLYKRGMFPRATKCPDYEANTDEGALE